MSERAEPPASTADLHGPRWGARAADWATFGAPVTWPAWRAVADAVEVGPGTRVLDVGCGTGEFCRLVASRGGRASGIDAAAGMIEVARSKGEDVEYRVGPMETLPWADGTFDVVTGFNAFQFAADLVAALAEARRVTRSGGRVAICVWARPEDNALFDVVRPLGLLQRPSGGPPARDAPSTGEPGVLEGLARRAGLEPVEADEVDTPFEAPHEETLVRAVSATGGAVAAIEHSGELAVREAIVAAAAPFRRADGSYRLENRFRYVVCRTDGP